MKNVMAVILSVFFVLAGFACSMAADQDIKGSKDRPLLSRMPDFHISDYKYTEFDSHRFNDRRQKTCQRRRPQILHRIQAEQGRGRARRIENPPEYPGRLEENRRKGRLRR